MPILIDGHNLIGRLPTLSLSDPDDEEKLVRRLQSYRARTGKSITVIFDPGAGFASPEVRLGGGIEIVFAPHGSSADAVIARRIRRSQNPRGWRVVTSDAALASTVTRLGARVQPAESFAAELEALAATAAEQTDRPLPPAEVEAWLALFESRDTNDDVA